MTRRRTLTPVSLTNADARRIWLSAQRLDVSEPFGAGPAATRAAVEHLGYVQIDTINVIERCHHHILFSRIPAYRRADLHQAQAVEKSVFEYWTHALSYVPTRDMRFYVRAMRRDWRERSRYFAAVNPGDVARVVRRVRKEGALTIRDIDDDEPVEKVHLWASRKPSKRALEIAFYKGLLTVSQRAGMVKTYELAERHFGWERAPKPASERETIAYLLDRALGAQGIVSLDSICHLRARWKPAVLREIEARVRKGELVPVALEDAKRQEHWARPEALEPSEPVSDDVVHILSPFDPLIIQRRRLELLFGYRHLFEAYVPKEKRVLGYFALPVLVGDRIVAALDLKTDRAAGKLRVQKWTWVHRGEARRLKPGIEAALDRFERFQLARDEPQPSPVQISE